MANFKLNSVLVASESGGTIVLDSAVTGIPAAGVTGALPVGVTGGSGVDAVNAANIASGTLPVGVTGGSGLDAVPAAGVTGTLPNAVIDNITRLGTVTSGDISAISPVGGNVLQVKSSIFTGTFTIGSGSQQDPEEWHFFGLSVDITPTSTSNKILLMANVVHASDNNSYLTILRGGSTGLAGGASNNLAVPTSPGSRQPTFTGDGSVTNTGYQSQGNSMIFLDSPNTTSSTTYNVGVSIHSTSTCYINRTKNDNNAGWQPRGVSTITAMEIKG